MSLPDIIEELHAARRRFERGSARRKRVLLDRAARLPITPSRALRSYHDLLLFLLAYPDDRAVFDRATRELRRCADAARRLRGLDDSGIAHTLTNCVYSFDTTSWLAERFGKSVGLDWEDDALGQAVDHVLGALVSRGEGDGLLHRGVSTREWFRAARGGHSGGDLAWFLDRVRRLDCADIVRDQLFEPLDVRLRWRLSSPRASRTFLRFPARSTAFQTGPLERGVAFRDVIDEALPRVRPLPVAAGQSLIDTARATLAVRHRETDPVTYANPREVYLLRLDRGLDVAIFGMRPGRRLPIESFFGYLAAKNRVPIAYGGGWVFLDRCEIGINIFDALRGGESAWTFAQICRVYRQLFSARRFTVDPFQFGEDNDDAIRSGAFWFYYRFGFRPEDERLRDVAAKEWARIATDRTYRTSRPTLRRFVESPLAFVVDENDPGEPPPDLPTLGLAVTRWVGSRFAGDRERAQAHATQHVSKALGVRGIDAWPESQGGGFEQLSPLVAMVPGLARWPERAKRGLVALMRAKGGACERTYADRLRRHGELRQALREIAGGRG